MSVDLHSISVGHWADHTNEEPPSLLGCRLSSLEDETPYPGDESLSLFDGSIKSSGLGLFDAIRRAAHFRGSRQRGVV
ncbi:hypothetical protein EJ06DRAFT_527633 [Trichodelitschia bisporula]|uniref:Uncharacterized protein n=1 Tax=Trichodelitschia bisporula TaxID=703511 RepID=A0A6G1I3M8_9PEZI|nr:hypothetical protein EJ06DRAFT_527633 [Trichodelitschia bisporula]